MKLIIFISLLVFATAACDDSSEREAAEAARQAYAARAIDDERGRINGLSIGSNEAAVVAAFGQPLKIEESFSELEGKPARSLFYDGIEIYLIGDEIYNLKCASTNCMTHDGITLGDPAGKILTIFKKGEPEPRDDGTDVLRYPLANADVYLIHKLKDGKVVGLELWFDFS